MPVIDAITDLEALTLTFVTEHDAPVERVWLLWADPRQLERWWGPPGWPATVTEHIYRIRRKLEPGPDSPRWIHTVRGNGYRFAG